MRNAHTLFGFFDYGKTMFTAYLVRNLTEFRPRSFSSAALIFLGGEAEMIIDIRIVKDNVRMQVFMITVNGKDILVSAFQITVA